MTTLAHAPTSRMDGVTLFIGGAWRRADETYERFDPANLERSIGVFAAATPDMLRQVLAVGGKVEG